MLVRGVWYRLLSLCFNDRATAELYTEEIVGRVRCVEESGTHLTTLAKPGAIEEAAEAAAILPELHSAEVVVAGPLASIFSV